MNEIDKILAFNAMETVKDIPPYLQPLSLLLALETDKTGIQAPLAQVLSKYGVPIVKILPCIADIMEVFMISDDSKDGESNVPGQGD